MAEDASIIVVKRVKKGGHGHHGGAWKVALADFVTAMMAFFMLMWLMGSTTPEQKAAISNFFQNPSAIAGPGGASTSMIKLGGTLDLAPKTIQPRKSLTPPAPAKPAEGGKQQAPKPANATISAQTAEKIAEEHERERLESLMNDLKRAIAASQALAPFKDQLLLDITSEGLRIQIVDKKNRPMFESGSAQLKGYTRQILDEIAKVIDQVPNRISIAGHTDAKPYLSHKGGYSNWELSTDRANAARRELVRAGMRPSKVGRVIGLASSALFDKKNPFDPINRRISIVVMNKKTEEALGHESTPVAAAKLAGALSAKGGGETAVPPADAAATAPPAAPAATPAKTTSAR